MLDFLKPRDYLTELEKEGLKQFGAVVVWSSIVLVVLLFAAILLVRLEGKKINPGNYNPHPSSQILLHPSETVA